MRLGGGAVIDFGDPKLHRMLARLARSFDHLHIADDLKSVGMMAVMRSAPEYDPARSPWLFFAWKHAKWAMSDHVKYERRRRRLALPRGAFAREGDEPDDGLVRLMGLLTDNEAQVLTLACGMDGADERTLSDVAWMMGKHTTSVCRWYRNGLAKLRDCIERAQLEATGT
jgi:DNA-directed RNA polymerase specialized sigma24 family protein